MSNVLEVIEEVELYLKEMLFIVEHESEKTSLPAMPKHIYISTSSRQ
jgi:hypothetical protein